jgi:hypothetical protein
MTINNLDKILKNLDDFDPQAKPNWDAFLAENESSLNIDKTPARSSGESIRISQGIKFTGILVLSLAVFFSTWYFTTDNQSADSQQTPEKHQATQSPDNTTKSFNTEQDFQLNEQLVPLPEQSNQLIEDNTIFGNNPIETNATELNPMDDNQVQLDETIGTVPNPEVSQEQNTTETVIRITDTVVVKKTIIVKDTVRIPKHFKK